MKYLGWALAALMAIYILWPHGPAPMDNSAELRRENDSLRTAIEGRDIREQLLWERADSLARIHDSTINNLPSARVRYLAAAYALRTAPLDSLWMFMGTWPADTGIIR